jgi:hypothetical protein
MSYLFFFSYARANTKQQQDSELVTRFVEALQSDVDQITAGSGEEICFFDRTDIEAGSIWPSDLSDALRTARVGVCLYSPHYFASKWCGKELQVFLNRASVTALEPGGPTPTAIVPVIWIPALQGLPAPLKDIQTHDAAFPASYRQLGLRQTMRIGSPADFATIVNALAHRIVSATRASSLPTLPSLDLDTVPSTWDTTTNADPASHKKGCITKTCFIYAAKDGWDWKPYESNQTIGAIAQQVSGELGLKYEEISCNASLPARLTETRDNDVPTVLFADPSSFAISSIETPLRAYDGLYLLNCGLIVPWERATPPPATDPRWHHVCTRVCPQKAAAPPPFHEWLSTATFLDLKSKTVAVIEGIRGQLLKRILGSNAPIVLKAESPQLTKQAQEQQGLRLDIAPQLVSTGSI